MWCDLYCLPRKINVVTEFNFHFEIRSSHEAYTLLLLEIEIEIPDGVFVDDSRRCSGARERQWYLWHLFLLCSDSDDTL